MAHMKSLDHDSLEHSTGFWLALHPKRGSVIDHALSRSVPSSCDTFASLRLFLASKRERVFCLHLSRFKCWIFDSGIGSLRLATDLREIKMLTTSPLDTSNVVDLCGELVRVIPADLLTAHIFGPELQQQFSRQKYFGLCPSFATCLQQISKCLFVRFCG